jgi:hypothetical protein
VEQSLRLVSHGAFLLTRSVQFVNDAQALQRKLWRDLVNDAGVLVE